MMRCEETLGAAVARGISCAPDQGGIMDSNIGTAREYLT